MPPSGPFSCGWRREPLLGALCGCFSRTRMEAGSSRCTARLAHAAPRPPPLDLELPLSPPLDLELPLPPPNRDCSPANLAPEEVAALILDLPRRLQVYSPPLGARLPRRRLKLGATPRSRLGTRPVQLCSPSPGARLIHDRT
jgi:hypothetical protein